MKYSFPYGKVNRLNQKNFNRNISNNLRRRLQSVWINHQMITLLIVLINAIIRWKFWSTLKDEEYANVKNSQMWRIRQVSSFRLMTELLQMIADNHNVWFALIKSFESKLLIRASKIQFAIFRFTTANHFSSSKSKINFGIGYWDSHLRKFRFSLKHRWVWRAWRSFCSDSLMRFYAGDRPPAWQMRRRLAVFIHKFTFDSSSTISNFTLIQK